MTSGPNFNATSKILDSPTTPEFVVLSSDEERTRVEKEPNASPVKLPKAEVPSLPRAAPAILVLNQDQSPISAFDGLSSQFHVIFDDKLIALATAADNQLQRVKAAVLARKASSLKTRDPYFYRCFPRLHVKSGCLFHDHKLVVPTCFHAAILNRLHEDHSGSAAMLERAESIWWPHLRREIKHKASNCTECAYVGENLKYILPRLHTRCPKMSTNSTVLDYLRSDSKASHYPEDWNYPSDPDFVDIPDTDIPVLPAPTLKHRTKKRRATQAPLPSTPPGSQSSKSEPAKIVMLWALLF